MLRASTRSSKRKLEVDGEPSTEATTPAAPRSEAALSRSAFGDMVGEELSCGIW